MAYVDRRTYHAIKNAPSTEEKKLINFYELQWFLNKKIPTTAEVAEHLKCPQTSVNYYLRRAPVVTALNKRGIPWERHSQVNLTPEQIAAASLVMNFADERSIADKLDSLGVNTTQYQGWLRDPRFKALIDSHADQNLANIRPTAVAEFTKKINQGDWNAIKFWMEATGELGGKNNLDPANFMMMIIEILQKHVKDPVILGAIAADLQLAAANKSLESAVIEGVAQPVNEVEFDNARKQLGV